MSTRRLLVGFLCASCMLAAGTARAMDWDLSLDLRLVDADGPDSFLDGGTGKLRFDSDDRGVRVGRVRGAVHHPIGEVFALKIDASMWGDEDTNPVDITEAYLEYRPYPHAGVRTRMRAGAFYPPASLANHGAGWECAYTQSSSALDTWIAEEIRAIGLEGRMEWLGTRLGKDIDLGFTAGVFGWNDPAGVLIASHGFALHDRQTPLFGRVGPRDSQTLPGRQLFHEIDERPGYYLGAEARYFDRAALRVLHYDNRGDPTVYDAGLDDFAWETRFDSAGVRAETARGWTAIAQWLGGETYIAPGGDLLEWTFETAYVLLARRVGRHQVSARYDEFAVETDAGGSPGGEDGDAWTIAYRFERDANWWFTLEWLRVRSEAPAQYVGWAPLPTESKVELAIRYHVRSAP